MAVKANTDNVPTPTIIAPPSSTPEPTDQAIPKTDLPFPTEVAKGVSKEDLAWWGLPQNRNFMAGDGPQAGQTEVDGEHQTASSMDPEVRAAGLAKSKAEAAKREADAKKDAESDTE